MTTPYETWKALLQDPADEAAADAYAVQHRHEIGQSLAEESAPKPPSHYDTWRSMLENPVTRASADRFYEQHWRSINMAIEAKRRGGK